MTETLETKLMDSGGKAVRIRLLDFSTPQMRAFHMTWFAFFLCFFAWFGIAPLMMVVRDELHLSRSQIGWCIIGSVAITVIARVFIGWLCDRIGPRLAYTGLLLIGSLPVMGIGLAHDFATFLLFRVAIGLIGASFVITQYHTSLMFAPNCVGTANATTAGWGNLGGGVTQVVMPLLFAAFVGLLGFSESIGWRMAMFVAGVVCALTGVAYYLLTQDRPDGNFRELRAAGKLPSGRQGSESFAAVCKDPRVWTLCVIYGACFGIELTINNVVALYFLDYFDVFGQMETFAAIRTAGLAAAVYGSMNLFARPLGGLVGDRFGAIWGLNGRVKWLFLTLLGEGLALMFFSQMRVLAAAVPALMIFAVFVQMSNGATYSVVPFINKNSLGKVAGIVGAGGNAGAVAAGFLFKAAIPWPTALFLLGLLVTGSAFLCFAVRFSPEAESEARTALEAALVSRRQPELIGAVD